MIAPRALADEVNLLEGLLPLVDSDPLYAFLRGAQLGLLFAAGGEEKPSAVVIERAGCAIVRLQ